MKKYKCIKCDNDIYENFCKVCGTTNTYKFEKREKKEFKKITAKKIMILAGMIAILGTLFITYVNLKDNYTPEKTVEKYCECLEKGKYDDAFGLLENIDNKLLSKDAYSKYIQEQGFKDKKLISITKISESDKKYSCSVKMENATFNVDVDKNGKKALIFDNWEINPKSFTKNFSFISFKDAEIFIEGVPIKKIEATDEGFYTLSADVFPGKYDMTGKMQDAEDFKTNINTEYYTGFKFKPSKDACKQLEELVKNYYEDYFSKNDVLKYFSNSEAVTEKFKGKIKKGVKIDSTLMRTDLGTEYIKNKHIRANMDIKVKKEIINISMQFEKVNNKWLIYVVENENNIDLLFTEK